jgi:hypothetical protein
MLARSGIIRISAGSLGVGLLAGAAVGLLTAGTASPQTTATTTSTTTTTTTVPPAPSTTILTVPPPSVIEFFASPSDPTCLRGERQIRVVLIWSSQDADTVSIEADGSALVTDAQPTGRRGVVFDCPSGSSESHDLQLIATAADGSTASKSATVTVSAAPTSGRDGRVTSPDSQG